MRGSSKLWLSASGVALAIAAMPASAQTADAADGSTTAPTAQQDIVVTGLRASLAKAQDIKKNSDEIVDSLVAEDIGKFPDVNAIEAVARVPGVQIGRRNDEGFQTLVRGLTQVTTTLNGRESFTTTARTFALQEFSSDSLAGIDVFKANTAVNLEAGLGGLINVRLRRAFDLPEGLTVAGGVRAQYYDLTKKVDPLANALVSYRWHTGIGEFGILANVAYAGTKGYNQSVRYDGTFNTAQFPVTGQLVNGVATVGGNSAGTAVPTNNQFNTPTDMGIFLARGRRFRPSATLSLQWAPDNDTMLYVEGFYQGLRADIRDSQFANLLVGKNFAFTNAATGVATTVTPALNNVVLSSTNGPTGYPYLQSATVSYDPSVLAGQGPNWVGQGRRIELNTVQAAIGGTKTMGDAKLSFDVAYTDSWQLDWQRQLQQYVAVPFTGSYVTNGPNYGATLGVNFDTGNIANWRLRNFFENYNQLRGYSWQGRFDGVLTVHDSIIKEIDFGGRASTHTAYTYGGQRDTNNVTSIANIPITSLPGYAPFTFALPFRGTQQGINPIATLNADVWTSNWGSYLNYFRQLAATSTAPGAAGVAAAFATDIPQFDPTRYFRVNEQVYAAYGQIKALVDVGFPIDAIAGARIVNTQTTETQSSRPNGVLTQFTGKTNYVDVLPNFSLRARFTPKLQMRLSFTKSLYRPEFNQISPAVNYNSALVGGYIVASVGNPKLNPTRADNYDATLEYYFSRTGFVSVGVFDKEVSGFVFNQQVILPSYPGVPCDPTAGCQGVRLTQNLNAADARIRGAEFAFNSFFTFLPAPFDGFGVSGNVTYLDARQRQPISNAVGAPLSAYFVPQNISKWTYNLTGYFEKGPFGARLSYNRRSAFPNNQNVTGAGTFIFQYSKAISRLDASASLRLTKWLSLTADATNLLGTPFIDYNTNPTYPVDVRYESRTFSIGARARF